jgi:hypothetical protein
MSTGDQYRSGRSRSPDRAGTRGGSNGDCRRGTLRCPSAMLPLVHRLAAVGLVADLVGLLVADAVAWRRTRAIRVGSLPSVAVPPHQGPPAYAVLGSRGARASRATFLAGAAGLWALGYGATTPRASGWGSPALVVAGGFVILTGLAGRVRAVRAGRTGMVVRYAARRSLVLSWSGCRELRPPRTMLGGWRVIGSDGSRCLMPSDVIRNEWLLSAIIEAAGLSFRGRRWVRDPRAGGSFDQPDRVIVPVICAGWTSQWKK